MIKKLSLKEKWLNDNPDTFNVVVNKLQEDGKKKEDKKSFFTGIFSSVKQFIKPEKKSTSTASTESNEGTDEKNENNKSNLINPKKLAVSSANEMENKKKTKEKKILKKQKSDEIREEADNILNDIKDENDRLSKQIRDMEIKRFSDNMQAIKSSVVDSKVASIKDVNLSKYFPAVQEKKPKAFVKNQDAKALKDVNLNKYFPTQSFSKTNDSNSSSANQSPLTPKKNIDDIDLTNYFPNTPVISRRNSLADDVNDHTKASSLTRKDSISRVTNVNSIPANPPPPKPKNNILSLQNVKRKGSKTTNEIKIQHDNICKGGAGNQNVKDSKSKDFNMFDQLLDGAIDIMQTKDFETIIEEVKLERSPSKEYDVIFNVKSRSKSKEESHSVSESPLKEINSIKNNENMMEIDKKIKVQKLGSHKFEVNDKSSENISLKEVSKNTLNRKINELPKLDKKNDILKNISDIKNGSSLSTKEDLNVEIVESIKIPIKEFTSDLHGNERIEEHIHDIIDESVASRLQRKYKKVATNILIEESVPSEIDGAIEEEDKVSFIEKLEQRIKERRKSLFEQSEIEEDRCNFDLKNYLVIKNEYNSPKPEVIISEINQSIQTIDFLAEQEKTANEVHDNKSETMKEVFVDSLESQLKNAKKECKVKKVTSDRKGKKSHLIEPLVKENINDILNDFQMTELETEKALKQFHQNFESLTSTKVDHKNEIENKKETLFFSNKSLQSNLQDIDANISDHPLNFDELFGQLTISSQHVPDKNETDSKDKPIDIATKIKNKTSCTLTDGKSKEADLKATSNYFNILKEISDELVCFDDKTIKLSKNDDIELKDTFENKSSDLCKNTNENYINFLQDISYELGNSNLYDKNISSKATPTYENIRFISPEQLNDCETVSGISSTEYFDHYYSVAHNNMMGKLSPPQVKMTEKPKTDIYSSNKIYSNKLHMRNKNEFSPKRDSYESYNQSEDSRVLLERGELLHKRKEAFLKGQSCDSSNPYIREMLRQDIENPIDIKDIQFIRKHPSAHLPSVSSASPYRLRNKETILLRPSPQRTSVYSYQNTQPRSYNTSKSIHDRYNSSKSLKYDILTKSHTISPHAINLYRPSYVDKREFSFSDPLPSVRSRVSARNSASHSSKKSSTARDNYHIY